MEHILNKESALEQLKYDLSVDNSDSEDEDAKEAALAIEENILREELERSIKSERMDSDIILPEASQSIHRQDPKKKEIKTKKEMEEEEREKMQ